MSKRRVGFPGPVTFPRDRKGLGASFRSDHSRGSTVVVWLCALTEAVGQYRNALHGSFAGILGGSFHRGSSLV